VDLIIQANILDSKSVALSPDGKFELHEYADVSFTQG
jgi:hypothetical protein